MNHGHQGSQEIFQPKLTSFHSHYHRLLPPSKQAVNFQSSSSFGVKLNPFHSIKSIIYLRIAYKCTKSQFRDKPHMK